MRQTMCATNSAPTNCCQVGRDSIALRGQQHCIRRTWHRHHFWKSSTVFTSSILCLCPTELIPSCQTPRARCLSGLHKRALTSLHPILTGVSAEIGGNTGNRSDVTWSVGFPASGVSSGSWGLTRAEATEAPTTFAGILSSACPELKAL